MVKWSMLPTVGHILRHIQNINWMPDIVLAGDKAVYFSVTIGPLKAENLWKGDTKIRMEVKYVNVGLIFERRL